MAGQVLVQISKRTGQIDRVPRDTTPVIEVHLQPGEYIASVELEPHVFDDFSRKTRDWKWTAFVVTPLTTTAPPQERT